jgi:hypothetical protein
MILFSVLLLTRALTAQAAPAHLLDCHYSFMSVPFSEVQLGFTETGPEEFVTISVQGRSHRESYTPAETAPDMLLHGWISKESKENSLEMIVYKEARKAGQSVLINSRMPMGKEMWGQCAIK